MRALRMRDLPEKLGIGESTIYRMVAEGKFPKPFEILPGRKAWIEEDIDEWLAEKSGKTASGSATQPSDSTADQVA